MKAKAIARKPYPAYQFFLFFVAPLLLGLLLTSKSMAKAEWASLEGANPTNYGWTLMDTPESPDLQLV